MLTLGAFGWRFLASKSFRMLFYDFLIAFLSFFFCPESRAFYKKLSKLSSLFTTNLKYSEDSLQEA
jgi:hypothetical protein